MQKKWTESKVEKLKAKGFGTGSGADYKPWIHVRDISSLGRKHLVPGTRFGRDIHLLSDVEFRLFLMLEWPDTVLDVNEQFPLDRDLTLDVASKLGIKHPYYPGTHVPTVMTADFLVTRIRNGHRVLEVFNAKSDSDTEDERQMEKLEIQRTALELMDIQHHLVVDSSIPRQKARNLELLESARVKPNEVEPSPGYFSEFAERFFLHGASSSSSAPGKLLHQVCSEFDHAHGAASGTGLRCAYILVKQKRVSVDLNSRHLADQRIGDFAFHEARSFKQVAGGLR